MPAIPTPYQGPMMDFDARHVSLQPVVAGLAGALIGLKFAPGLTWYERITNVACGWLAAVYVAPFMCEMFGFESAATQSGIAFATGLFGMSIIAEGFNAIRAFGPEILKGWFKRPGS